jgi:hypothetical protein
MSNRRANLIGAVSLAAAMLWGSPLAGLDRHGQSDPQEALLRRADIGGFAPVMRHERQAPSEIELWRSGQNQTLVRLLDPKERGKYLLRLGPDLWFLSPGTRKPVRLSPAHRVYGAATIDVLLGLRLADDYRVVTTTREAAPRGDLAIYELAARSESATFATVRYAVHVETERPASALYRLRSGKDAMSIEFQDWTASGRSARYAKRMIVRDLLRKGAETRIEVVEFDEREVPAGLFSLDDPTTRRALERGGR